MMRERRWFVVLGVLLISCLCVQGWLWFHWHKRTTESQHMRWFDGSGRLLFHKPGQAPAPVPSCQGDARFQMLALPNAAWTICHGGLYTTRHTSLYPSGVLVRFSLPQRTAHARWPLPSKLRHVHSVGVLPHTSGALAYVYRANTIQGPLVVGVAGQRGWNIPPFALSASGGRLLGMAWRGQALALVWVPQQSSDPNALRSDPQILTIHNPKRNHTTKISYQTLCQEARNCRLHAAFPTTTSWRFLAEARDLTKASTQPTKKPSSQPSSQPSSTHASPTPTKRPNVPRRKARVWWLQTEAPRRVARPQWNAYGFWMRSRLDLTAVGLLPDRPLALRARMGPKGKLTPLPKPARFDRKLKRQGNQLLWAKGQLRLRHWWLASKQLALHQLPQEKEGVRLIHSTYQEFHKVKQARKRVPIEDRLSLQKLDAYEITYSQPIARSPSQSCLTPTNGMFVPHPKGGHWLVHTTGCILQLSASWRRLDPVSLHQTYKQHKRRSKLHKSRIEWQLASLLWAFAGFPACLLVGLLLFPLVRMVQTKPSPAQELTLVGSLWAFPHLAMLLLISAYLVSFLWLWRPILRFLE